MKKRPSSAQEMFRKSEPIIRDSAFLSSLTLVSLFFIFVKAPLSADKAVIFVSSDPPIVVEPHYKIDMPRAVKPPAPDVGLYTEGFEEPDEIEEFPIDEPTLTEPTPLIDEPPIEEVPLNEWQVPVKPVLLNSIVPKYPEFARKSGVQGLVVVQFVINKEGIPENLNVIRGPALLHKAAKDAIAKYRYSPARMGELPVSIRQQVPIWFRIKN